MIRVMDASIPAKLMLMVGLIGRIGYAITMLLLMIAKASKASYRTAGKAVFVTRLRGADCIRGRDVSFIIARKAKARQERENKKERGRKNTSTRRHIPNLVNAFCKHYLRRSKPWLF